MIKQLLLTTILQVISMNLSLLIRNWVWTEHNHVLNMNRINCHQVPGNRGRVPTREATVFHHILQRFFVVLSREGQRHRLFCVWNDGACDIVYDHIGTCLCYCTLEYSRPQRSSMNFTGHMTAPGWPDHCQSPWPRHGLGGDMIPSVWRVEVCADVCVCVFKLYLHVITTFHVYTYIYIYVLYQHVDICSHMFTSVYVCIRMSMQICVCVKIFWTFTCLFTSMDVGFDLSIRSFHHVS